MSLAEDPAVARCIFREALDAYLLIDPATLAVLDANPAVYTHLEGLGRVLDEGMADVAARLGMPVQWNRVGAMGSLFFHDEPVVDWPSACESSRARFSALFHGLLAADIHLPPSPFEAWFWSYAHTSADMERLLEATEAVLRDPSLLDA